MVIRILGVAVAAFAIGSGCDDSSVPCLSSVAVEVETDADEFTAELRTGPLEVDQSCQQRPTMSGCDDEPYGKRLSFTVGTGSPYPYQLTLTRSGTGQKLEYTIGAEGRTCDTECCQFTDRIQANFLDE